jgi:hypothetical protein
MVTVIKAEPQNAQKNTEKHRMRISSRWMFSRTLADTASAPNTE